MQERLEIFPWNDYLTTGIPDIDAQHRRLVALLNALANALADSEGELAFPSVYRELEDYVVYHFQTEEALWHRSFPDTPWEAAHRKEHETFIRDLHRIGRESNTGSLRTTLEKTLVFLTHWLVFHILEADKRAAIFVRAIGTEPSLEAAREKAEQEMTDMSSFLLESVLGVTDHLVRTTFSLKRETLERKKKEEEARILASRNRVLMDHFPEGLCVLSPEGQILEANDAFCVQLGYTLKEILSLSLFDVDARHTSDEIRDILKEYLHGSGQFESVHRRKDGTLLDVEVVASGGEGGGIRSLLCLCRDITGRKKAEEAVRSLAFHDQLTQLPNRRLLDDRLRQALLHCRRSDSLGALMFVDLDNFKPINDRYGHHEGDLVLIETARRIRGCVRDLDTIGRLGGDEFLVILTDLAPDRSRALENVFMIADKIRAALAAPYTILIHDQEIAPVFVEAHCSASIGAVLIDGDGHGEPEALIRLADRAMYRAKETGRNRACVHEDGCVPN